MSDAKPKYANFPEREPKVLVGPNISAVTVKALTKLSIGTYEMSFLQQEKGKQTADAARTALNHLGKANGYKLASESSKEYVGVFSAANEQIEIKLWITTPFELTQAGHVIWVRVKDLTEPNKLGVAFKLATAFTADEITNLIKTAQKNVVTLAEGEPYTVKGNPPPRFQKKAAPAADAPAGDGASDAPAPGEAPASSEAPASEAAAGDAPA